MTKWIRQEAELAGYKWPYCGEVGYNMTRTPPIPLTSKNEPHRPSNFPLSQFRVVFREYREINTYGDPEGSYLFDFSGADTIDPMVSKTELENTLALKRSGDNDIVEDYRTINPKVAKDRFPNGRGMIRIPDIIKKKDHRLLGEEGYSPNNIDTVIEVKFPGDTLSRYQQEDYLIIASNNRNKFRLMTLEQCEYRRRGKKEEEEMLTKAKADPIFQVVGETALTNPQQVLSIEQQIQMEYDAFSKHVIKWIKQQEVEYSRPQIFAQDNTNREALEQGWKRYEQHHEQVVNAPLAAVGVAIIGAMTAGMSFMASSAESLAAATVTRSGAKVIELFPIIRTTVIAGGVAANAERLAAKEKSTNSYILENNNQLTYYADFDKQEHLKYQDDRLIEIDYRYQKNIGQIKPIMDIEDDSMQARQNRDKYRLDERGRKIHYYPARQQFYYYFIPGDEPSDDEGSNIGECVVPKITG
ncbi:MULTISPECIES: hypothetical protein [unclassified Gilliamella]|nr:MULTISPECIES: hypothetical protein [unclassified Gilliamella]MCX8587158.1 hypothetical protein [Gilliamella sp. B3801]MCX8592088.1 hypothetical protein [Gilliamella sp. B3804]